jgi:hypothetical protein
MPAARKNARHSSVHGVVGDNPARASAGNRNEQGRGFYNWPACMAVNPDLALKTAPSVVIVPVGRPCSTFPFAVAPRRLQNAITPKMRIPGMDPGPFAVRASGLSPLAETAAPSGHLPGVAPLVALKKGVFRALVSGSPCSVLPALGGCVHECEATMMEGLR